MNGRLAEPVSLIYITIARDTICTLSASPRLTRRNIVAISPASFRVIRRRVLARHRAQRVARIVFDMFSDCDGEIILTFDGDGAAACATELAFMLMPTGELPAVR